jgi:hypothetical protein
MMFSPLPCPLLPLRPKYSPQRPVLKHPQPTFLPLYQRPSFTPIRNSNSDSANKYLFAFYMLTEYYSSDISPSCFPDKISFAFIITISATHGLLSRVKKFSTNLTKFQTPRKVTCRKFHTENLQTVQNPVL